MTEGLTKHLPALLSNSNYIYILLLLKKCHLASDVPESYHPDWCKEAQTHGSISSYQISLHRAQPSLEFLKDTSAFFISAVLTALVKAMFSGTFWGVQKYKEFSDLTNKSILTLPFPFDPSSIVCPVHSSNSTLFMVIHCYSLTSVMPAVYYDWIRVFLPKCSFLSQGRMLPYQRFFPVHFYIQAFLVQSSQDEFPRVFCWFLPVPICQVLQVFW